MVATLAIGFVTGNAYRQLRHDQEVVDYYGNTNPPASFVEQERATLYADEDRLRTDGLVLATCIVIDGLTFMALRSRARATAALRPPDTT